jgi:arginyl-tRNA synthetase
VKRQLAQIFDVSLKATVPDEEDVVPLVDVCTAKTGGVKFGDYQW